MPTPGSARLRTTVAPLRPTHYVRRPATLIRRARELAQRLTREAVIARHLPQTSGELRAHRTEIQTAPRCATLAPMRRKVLPYQQRVRLQQLVVCPRRFGFGSSERQGKTLSE